MLIDTDRINEMPESLKKNEDIIKAIFQRKK